MTHRPACTSPTHQGPARSLAAPAGSESGGVHLPLRSHFRQACRDVLALLRGYSRPGVGKSRFADSVADRGLDGHVQQEKENDGRDKACGQLKSGHLPEHGFHLLDRVHGASSCSSQPQCIAREGRNAQAWREIAYFLCAQADGLHFVGASKKPKQDGVAPCATAASAGPRMIPDGNHGDNSSLADGGSEMGSCSLCGYGFGACGSIGCVE